ncbi:hypothetical protein [Kineococcus glutinatus]|uniref:Uncharacterized protein n=1 Tax=Kineococcus glutinatus TaxID=1070872 RepID=A0ABP9I1N1_9ACTN
MGVDDHNHEVGVRVEGTVQPAAADATVTDGLPLFPLCACGWTGPDVVRGPYTSELDEPCYDVWVREHWERLVGPDPATVLEGRRTDHGQQWFLGEQTVHPGQALDLLLPAGRWLHGHLVIVDVQDERPRKAPHLDFALGGVWESTDCTDYSMNAMVGIPPSAALRVCPHPDSSPAHLVIHE